MNERITLLKPELMHSEAILNYKKEFKTLIAGSSRLESFDSVGDWLYNLKKYESEQTLPDSNHVPGIQYVLLNESQNKILGMGNLRVKLNDYLLNFGGHIGYSIAPSERRKGYGKIILKKLMNEARKGGLNRVLVTCNESNIGSSKIILDNQGILENKLFDSADQEWVNRYWIEL